MGASTAFFTFTSRRSRSRKFFLYYLGWLAIQFAVPLILIGLFLPRAWIELIFEGEKRGLVVLAFIAVFFQTQVWPTVIQIGESQRLTHRVQGVNLGVATAHCVLVVLLWLTNTLNVVNVFVLIFVEHSIAAVVGYRLVEIKTIYARTSTGLRDILNEYKVYCLPLIPYVCMGFLYEFSDRWLLQHYGGAIEQAYYGVSVRFSYAALIATTAMVRIFWKEIADAHEQKNHERISMLYRKISRILYMITAVVGGFLIPWAAEIVSLVLGPAYIGGTTVLAIMFLFPLPTTLVQINATVFYATGQTKAYVTIGMIFMAASVIASYFVLAPTNAVIPGLGMASAGLALKMVVMITFQAAMMSWYIARVQGWRLDLAYTLVGLGVTLACGFFVRQIADWMLAGGLPVLSVVVVTPLAYLGCLAIGLLAMPWLIDMSRTGVIDGTSRLVRQLFARPRGV